MESQERITANSDAVMWRLTSQAGRPGGRLSITATPTRLTTDNAMTAIITGAV
jgi:hypothetical protein